MSIIGKRGGESILDEKDLRVHIANLLRLENVGIFLGSGASVDAGGKTVPKVWDNFEEDYNDSVEKFQNFGFIEQQNNNPPNVEELLDSLEIARIDWKRRDPESQELIEFEADIANLHRCLLEASILSPAKWENPDYKVDGLNHHIKLLQRTIGARQPGQPSPWIFTVNYDLAVEWAAETVGIHVHTGFLGIHNRIFSPQSFDLGFQNTQSRGEARFGNNDVYLVKLHGSLTWHKSNELDYRELAAKEAWPEIGKIIKGNGNLDDSIMVFPRASKYLQTTGYHAGELFRRFSDFLSRPQSCLLMFGYSFGDNHLNRIVKSALLNPTLQIVIFLPEIEQEINGFQCENLFITELLALESPRITFIGGGEKAYFDKAVKLFPDPALYDLAEKELRERMCPPSDQNNEN